MNMLLKGKQLIMESILSRYKCIWKEVTGTIIMIIPILIYAGLSMPAADDFTNAVSTMEYWNKYPNSLIAAAVKTFDLYFDVGGYYFSAYLNFFFVPILRFGINGIRVFNVLTHIFFFFSAYYMVASFTNYVLRGNLKLKWLLFVLFLFSLINNYCNSEIYTWYCVMVAYVLPLAFMFIMVGLFIRSCYTGNILVLMLASVIGFLVSGATLNTVALNCEIIFLIGLYLYFVLGRKRDALIISSFVLTGAIVNAIAPGNFARHELTSHDYSLWMPIVNAVFITLKLLVKKILFTWFVPIFVAVFILIYNYCDLRTINVEVYSPIRVFLLFFIGVSLVNFPVVFGYSADGLPDRCVFVQDVAVYLFGFLWVINLVGWFKNKYGYESIHLELIRSYYDKIMTHKLGWVAKVICLYYVIVLFCVPMTTIQMIYSIENNTLKDYIIYEQDILNEIESSNNEVIGIKRSYKLSSRFMMDLGLSEDSSNWVNKSMCLFYNKKEISVNYINDKKLRGTNFLEYVFKGNGK